MPGPARQSETSYRMPRPTQIGRGLPDALRGPGRVLTGRDLLVQSRCAGRDRGRMPLAGANGNEGASMRKPRSFRALVWSSVVVFVLSMATAAGHDLGSAIVALVVGWLCGE